MKVSVAIVTLALVVVATTAQVIREDGVAIHDTPYERRTQRIANYIRQTEENPSGLKLYGDLVPDPWVTGEDLGTLLARKAPPPTSSGLQTRALNSGLQVDNIWRLPGGGQRPRGEDWQVTSHQQQGQQYRQAYNRPAQQHYTPQRPSARLRSFSSSHYTNRQWQQHNPSESGRSESIRYRAPTQEFPQSSWQVVNPAPRSQWTTTSSRRVGQLRSLEAPRPRIEPLPPPQHALPNYPRSGGGQGLLQAEGDSMSTRHRTSSGLNYPVLGEGTDYDRARSAPGDRVVLFA